jgi:hypothetical protein
MVVKQDRYAREVKAPVNSIAGKNPSAAITYAASLDERRACPESLASEFGVFPSPGVPTFSSVPAEPEFLQVRDLRDSVHALAARESVGSPTTQRPLSTALGDNMVGRSRKLKPVGDLEIEDLAQEIDEPLGDRNERRDEPTLTKIDFEENDVLLDF